jgi:hypothetical protein
VAAAAGIVAYAWWATGLAAFSVPALAAVLGAGAAAAAWGIRRPARRRLRMTLSPGQRVVGALAIATALGWELTAFLQRPREEHPTLSVFANRLLDPHPVRAAAFVAWLAVTAALARYGRPSARWLLLAGWLWLGWHLFVRASR